MAGGNVRQVTLKINADTQAAQQQISALLTQLKGIGNLQMESNGMNKGLDQAYKSAEMLHGILQKVVNVDTGKINMGAFTSELSKSGTTLSQLSTQLLQVGPAGAQAFRNLASSVAAAEMPIRKMNGALQGMLTSLANTAKWQLSSSAIHAVMSGFSSMVGYVKDLNSSLNNIRIVTGQSVDDMARFAQEANKAAKALSTTTKSYADAALIYYQQGDSQEMAAKKAAITIKAANASFETSAKEMSEYLTAVWNSYQVGANELERYVDIMAALGAKTATSLEEIATSMQKVAATANTVGVSMEQVSSIISTVSSVTRESAESIGTSYKTIFARIGDLKLGKTLEDGVGLGQVSSQLKKIGVNILDAQGNMRDMGKVIEELMGKWQQLSRAEQTATAQVVAGKRQYTQLMALMENSKMYQKNMGIATNAEGSLQTMADTYAESWSAAADRVRASWEGVWDSLLNDEAIISMMNGLAVFIQGIEDVIDGLGGLQGVLLNIGTVVTTIFQKNMTNGINQAIMSLKTFKNSFNGMSAGTAVRSFFTQTTSQRQQIQDTNTIISQSNAYMTNRLKFNPNYKSTMEARQLQLTNQLIAAKQKLQQAGNKMSVADQANNQQAIEGLERQIQKVNQLQAETEEAKASLGQTTVAATNATQVAGGSTTTARQTAAAWAQYNVGQMLFTDKDTQSQFGMATAYKQIETTARGIGNAVGGARMAMEEFNAAIANGQDKITTADALVDSLGDSVQALLMLQSDGLIRGDQIQKDMQDIEFLMGKVKQAQANGNIDGKGGVKDWSTHLSRKLNATFSRASINAGEAQKALKSIGFSDADIASIQRGAQIYVDANGRMVIAARQAEGASKRQNKQFQDTATQTASLGQKIAAVASSFMSAGSIMSSMSSLVQSEGESITSTVTSVISMISSAVMSATMAFQASNPLGWISLAVSAISAVAGYLIGEQEKTVQKTKEQAKTLKNALNEKVDKHSEEISSMQTLLSQFNDLYAQKKAGANVDAELATAATELAAAYNITGAAVANLTGDYENLIKKLQNLGSTDYQQINDSWMLGSMTNYANAVVQLEKDSFSHANNTITFSEETHRLLSKDATTEWTLSAQDVAKITALIESGYTAPLNSTWTNTEWYNKLAWAADTALFWWAEPDVGKYTFGEQMQTYDLGDVALSNKVKHKNGNQLDMTNAEVLSAYDQAKGTSVSNYFLDNNGNAQLTIGGNAQFAYHQYQELQDLLVYMEALGLDTTTGLGGQISAYLALVKTDMENYEQALEQFGKAVVTKESLRFAGKDAGVNYSFDTFTEDFNKSFDAYLALLQQQYGLTKTPEELKSMAYEAAMSGVNLNSSLDSYALALQAAYEITKDLAVAQTTVSTIMAQYKIDPKYIDEAIIMAHYNGNEEYLEAIINSRQKTQAYDEAKNIQTKTTDAAKMLKEDMTFDEMEELYNQLEWGENGIIAWTDFYAMSYEDKRAYLEQLSDDYVQASLRAAEQAKIAAEAERDAANQAVTDHVSDASASVTARMYNTVLLDKQRFAFDEDDNELVIRPDAVTTREEREFLDAYNEFLNDPANADKNQDDFLKDYFLTMVEQDAIKDARYADFANAVELKADGSWGFKQDVQTTPEMSSTMLEWRAWSADPNNAGKTVADFVVEKQGEGMGGFSQDVIDEYNRLIAEAEAANIAIDDAFREQALWQAMASQVESTATQVERLSKALSQLPTNTKDLQKIADALYGGDIDDLVGSTVAERAEKMVTWLSNNQPTLKTTKEYRFKDYEQYKAWAEGKNLSPVSQEDFNNGKVALPDGTTWEQIQQDLGDGNQLIETEVEQWGQYLADIASYDQAMGAILAIKNQNVRDDLDQLEALESGFENFVESGTMSDETKNALELLGIDPDTIDSVDDYVKAINKISTARTQYANTLKTNLETYDDNLGFNIDWTKMDAGLSYEEFIAQQTQLTEAQRNSLLLMTNFSQAYEEWRQADVEADDVGVDTEAVKARNAMNKAIAASTQNIEELEQAATKAKTAIDALNGALGNGQPLSFEAIEQLEQAGITATNWGDGTGADALGIYGTALGKSAMAQIDALMAKQANYTLAQSTIKTNDDIYHFSPADRAELGLPEPTEIDRRKTFDFDLMSLTNVDERDKLIQSMGFDGAALEQINAMIEKAKESGQSLTWSDIFANLETYNGELDGAMEIVWAQFKDNGVQAVQSILQAEQAAAQKTVDVWKNAFSAIIAAKEGIAEGKTLGESLAGDEGQLAVVLATAYQLGIDPRALLSGNGGANWTSITGHTNFQFDPVQYARAQGGATQFYYGPDGIAAADYHDMYGHASTLFTNNINTYWNAATAGKTEAELEKMGLTATSPEAMVKQLLDYYFPDGYWSPTGQEFYDARGIIDAAQYSAEIKEARSEFNAATTTYNKDYETRMARIGVYKEIEQAVAQSMLPENAGRSVADIIGEERMAEIEAEYGITASQVNAPGVSNWISSGISTEMAAINDAYATYISTVEQIDNLDLIGDLDTLTEDTTNQLDAANLLYGDGSTKRYEAMTNIIKNLAEAYGMSEEGMRRYIIAADKANGGTGVITADTLKLANAMLAQQAAVDAATESLDGYITAINKGDKTSIEYQNSLDGIRKIVGGILGLDADATQGLSDTLITDTSFLTLLQKIVTGTATPEEWDTFKAKYTNDTASTNKDDVSNTTFTADTTGGEDKEFSKKIAKIQHEAQILEQEMEALNSIDITEMPIAGTAAYEALSASLQKAGKSMSDYSKMSQKERAQALEDAKVTKLREQKIKNAELIKAYEDKYDFENANYGWDDAVADNATTEYQAYLDAKERELELNQEIADTRQATQDQINEIGAQDAEARIAILEAEREIVQETVDAYTELADIMMQAAETGKLTAEEILKIQKLDKNLLTSWNNATTYAERVNIAAQARLKAMTQEVTAQQEAIDGITEAQILITKKGIDSTSIYKNTSFADENAFKTLMSQHLSAAGLDAVMKAWQTVNSKMTSTSTLTDFYNELEAELARMEAEGVEGIEEIKAAAQDAMADMYGDLGEYEVSMAQTVVDTWLSAFKQIAEARKQLIMGEDIGDSLTESWESYLSLAQAYGDGSLWTAYRSGALKPGDLKYQSETKLIEGLRDSMGMSTVNTPGKNLFDSNGNLLLGDALGDALGMEKTAARTVKVEVVDAQGNKSVKWQEQAAYDEAAILEYAAPYLKELMTNYGDLYTGTDSIDALVEKALAGDPAALAWIKKAYNWMDQTTKDYATAVKEDAKLAEVQATYDAKIQELTEQRDKAKLGASATDAIQETEASERTADTVAAALQQAGISPEAYMAMLREKGYDIKTLDDVAKLTDTQLESIETSFEQDAIAAGNAIIKAAQIFNAIVTSGGDEAALTAKLAVLGVTRDANGNIQGFGQYQGAGLNYGANTAVGQQASENITEATEEQNTLKNEYGVNNTEDTATRLANMAAKADMTTDEFKTYADTLNSMLSTQDQFNTETAEGREALYQYAAAVGESAKGFEELTAITEDTWKELKDGSKKGSKDWVKNITGLRSSMSKLFNTDMKHITADFVEDHLDELEKMATGTEEEAAAAQEAIQDDLIAAVMKADGLEATTLINAETGEAENALTYLQTKLDQWDGQEVGFTIDANTAGAEANVIASLQSMLDAGTMTASQISAALNAIGWEPEIHWETITLSDAQAASEYATVTDSAGNSHTVKVTEEMASSKTVQIPIIGSAKKISAPGGGARPESSGGGGGGGKPKTIEKKDPNDEKERYHEINQRLERMDQLLDKVSKHKDRAFGKSYLKNLEQEIKLMKQQEGMYERKLAEAKEWLEYDKGRLAEFGVTFDEFGNISNYDEVIEAAVAEYNAFVERYNAMSASEQKTSDENEEQKKAEEKLENLKEYISDYEDSVNNIYDLQNSILDTQNQQSALALETIQYKAEYQIEINEDDIELLEYFDKKWEETLEKQDDRLAGMIEHSAELQDNLSLLATEQQELDAAYAAGEINLADYVEGLREVKDGIMENLEALQELQETINELYGDTLDMISEKVEEQTGHIDAATEAMSSYITILGLMGRGKNFRELEAFYAKQVEYSLENAKAQRQHLDLLLQEKEYYDAIIASGEELSDTQKIWYQDLLENIDEVNSELLSSTEEVLNNIASEYENVINGIFKELDEVMGGAAGSLAGLADQYSYYTETQERYVTSAKELYEVSKLNRDIEKSIEDSTTTASKQMLAALKERINAQSELNELTEYDIEMNRLQYELALAKIGLEETQNAKDTVRLTRDESGNYVYQYTANDDKINEAQQQYEDVLQQINELAYNRTTELEQMFLDAQQQYYDAAQEIANDTTLTVEERTIKLNELYSRFCETQQYIQEQYQNATGHLMTSNSTIAQHYNDTLTAQAMNSRENINETIAGMIEDNQTYKDAFLETINQINEAQDEQKVKMDEVAATTQLDYVAMTKEVGNYDTAVKNAGDTLSKVLDGEGETAGMLDQIHTLGTAWDGFAKTLAETVIPKFETLLQNIVDTIRELANLEDTVNNTDLTPPSTGGETSGGPSDTSGTTDDGSGGQENQSEGTRKWRLAGYKASWNGNEKTYDTKQEADIALASWKNSYIENKRNEAVDYAYDAFDDYQERDDYINQAYADAKQFVKNNPGSVEQLKEWYTEYKTGGLADFTGPAWLDGTKSSPELVLNATDTQNMLSAIGTLRELDTDTIAMLVATLNAATASLFGALSGNYHAVGVSNTNTQELNQNVEIHADFPNVTDRNEIVEAIDDLVNRAAQFAQKKMQ